MDERHGVRDDEIISLGIRFAPLGQIVLSM